MKYGHVIEYDKRNIFLQKLCSKWCRRLAPDLLLFLDEVKASGLQLSFNISRYSLTWHTIKN